LTVRNERDGVGRGNKGDAKTLGKRTRSVIRKGR